MHLLPPAVPTGAAGENFKNLQTLLEILPKFYSLSENKYKSTEFYTIWVPK